MINIYLYNYRIFLQKHRIIWLRMERIKHGRNKGLEKSTSFIYKRSAAVTWRIRNTTQSIFIPTGVTKKEASVLGRGIIGGIIAGPAGAVVGALSAIDKNKKNK